jgi:hypothetical protein
LFPKDVVAGTGKVLWWKCPKGSDHEWRATGAARLNGHGCPVCSNKLVTVSNSLATTHPELAAEFHPTKNGDLRPSGVVAGTGRRVWWKCAAGPDHEWRTTGASRLAGGGCPACAGTQISVTNSLATYPDLAAEFHPTKNDHLTPADVLAGTSKRFWWQCSIDPRHEWVAAVAPRTARGVGCPSCAIGGFDPAKDGWLYFMCDDHRGLLQIGISNVPEQRLRHHEGRGWQLIDVSQGMPGDLARQWEREILEAIRRRGAMRPKDVGMPTFDGHTESWVRQSLPVGSLAELRAMVWADHDAPG